MARKIAAVVFSLGCVQASPLMALGLGELTLGSYLNEPLRAEVDLLNIEGLHEDQIKIRLATTDDFKRMGVDRAYFLTSISFDVEIDDSGRARIVLTSEDPVLEPYLDFIVEARWPSGRLLREYTVLVDPPVFDQAVPVVSASERVAELEGEPAPAKKKSPEVVSSGTRVDVRNTDLAPGEMPRRSFNAATSPSPISGSRYMIHRDDTLWQIASRARPAGASVHQTMLDIQRLNPDAFIGGNINRIKAGYIIYLPTEEEIRSGDLAAAQREVRAQNQAWRESKASEPDYGSGPSLRISADEPEDSTASTAAGAGSAGTSPGAATGAAALEDLEKSELARAELEERLASMEQQVETLQRIVSLKDDQIAALQGVLAGEEGAEAVALEDLEADTGMPADADEELDLLVGDDDAAAQETDIAELGDSSGEEVAGVSPGEGVAMGEVPEDALETATAPPSVPAPPPAAPAVADEGGISRLWYALAALLAVALGLAFMRRRKSAEEDVTPVETAAPAADAFADVKLKEQEVELEEPESAPESTTKPLREERGYGQRKHDEYASAVEASDALAEADIYIAYGRYPQAIDLLKNALINDPGNASYRLKLLQLYADTGDRAAAEGQLAELEALGDEDALAEARDALASGTRADATAGAPPGAGDLLAAGDDALEDDFSDLEIEQPDDEIEDELDLSVDFEKAEPAAERLEEELVIAADSNGLSTKLDLARAYMDMGDDEGARQILEEVAAEGSEELQAEARELLDRIG